MRILHIVDIKNPNSNGVVNAVMDYIKHEKKFAEVSIYCLNQTIKTKDLETFSYEDYDSLSKFIRASQKPDLVIFNEVYKKKYLKLYAECLKLKIKYIIIPHGCLVKTAQNDKKIKKAIGNYIFFNRFIANANAIQFLNTNEKNDSKFKYKNFIISGNGTDRFTNINAPIKNKIVYIGRYSIYHKGLDLLIEVCTKYKEWFITNNVKIFLFGRSSGDDLSILKKMIFENKIDQVMYINDAVYGEEKEKELNSSYAFIQTSRHEGQPMGIIEALAHAVPCIVTTGTTFADFVNEKKCGIGTEYNCDNVFDAIKKMVENKGMRNNFSENAFNESKKYFDWNIVIKDLIKEYTKIIEKNN